MLNSVARATRPCHEYGEASSVGFLEFITPDHYATLGLDRRCTLAQIREAYRLLVRRHHPDVNPASAEAVARTQELNAAYEVLSDPKQRRDYDLELDAESKRQISPSASQKIEVNISQDVLLRIEELIRGTRLMVRVDDPANPNGVEAYELIVPEKTAPGARFRIPRCAPFQNGFVIVRVKARPDHRFKVRGSDLRCDLRINPRRAAEGGTEHIPGAGASRVSVAIPRGVARGAVIRVSGEGLPTPRGGRGDLLVRITYKPTVSITRGGRR